MKVRTIKVTGMAIKESGRTYSTIGLGLISNLERFSSVNGNILPPLVGQTVLEILIIVMDVNWLKQSPNTYTPSSQKLYMNVEILIFACKTLVYRRSKGPESKFKFVLYWEFERYTGKLVLDTENDTGYNGCEQIMADSISWPPDY